MTTGINLNISPLDQYPVIKILTRSDITTSQLVLPRHAVEEHVVRNMDDDLRERLRDGDGRANIWLVDDEDLHQYFLTLVDRDHRYTIISWSQVRQNRDLREGQELRFGWINSRLHFIVMPSQKKGKREDEEDKEKNRKDKGDGSGSGGAQGAAERKEDDKENPAKKKLKTIKGESSQKGGVTVEP